jgi:hypothetical protein
LCGEPRALDELRAAVAEVALQMQLAPRTAAARTRSRRRLLAEATLDKLLLAIHHADQEL